MCLRTDEVACKQRSTPLFRPTFAALARYLPSLFLTFSLYEPLPVVVALPTFFHPPPLLRWILTGTLATHAVNPSPTLTAPLATKLFFSLSVTLLGCVLLTVKLVLLVAVPPGVVTLIEPVVAVEGTVAVIWVAEFTTNVAVTLLKVTAVVVKFAPLTVPLKFVPVIFTDVPVAPKVGVNEVIVGAGTGVTVKFVALVRCPAAV